MQQVRGVAHGEGGVTLTGRAPNTSTKSSLLSRSLSRPGQWSPCGVGGATHDTSHLRTHPCCTRAHFQRHGGTPGGRSRGCGHWWATDASPTHSHLPPLAPGVRWRAGERAVPQKGWGCVVVRTLRLSTNSCIRECTACQPIPPHLHSAYPCVPCPANPLLKPHPGLVLSGRQAKQRSHRGCEVCHCGCPHTAVSQPWVGWSRSRRRRPEILRQEV